MSMPFAFRRLHRVEDHRGRIPLLLRHHDHAVAPAPLGELLARRGAEGVARGEEHRALLGLEAARELADRGRLARAVHAGEEDHEGLRKRLREGLFERGEEPRERRLELAFELGGIRNPLVAGRLTQLLDQALGRGDPDVGRDELRLELLEEGLVDFRMGAKDAERILPARACQLEIGL
jgi:hypothetical protein